VWIQVAGTRPQPLRLVRSAQFMAHRALRYSRFEHLISLTRPRRSRVSGRSARLLPSDVILVASYLVNPREGFETISDPWLEASAGRDDLEIALSVSSSIHPGTFASICAGSLCWIIEERSAGAQVSRHIEVPHLGRAEVGA